MSEENTQGFVQADEFRPRDRDEAFEARMDAYFENLERMKQAKSAQ